MKKDSHENLLRLIQNSGDADLNEILSDPEAKKELFDYLRMKRMLSSLDPSDFPVPTTVLRPPISLWKKTGAFVLAAASLFFVFGLFLFYHKNEEKISLVTIEKARQGRCEKTAQENGAVVYQTVENSYCDLRLEGFGEFSIRILPETVVRMESRNEELNFIVQTGSALFSTIRKKEGSIVSANSPHLRAVMLGTSIFISASGSKERIVLIDGALRLEPSQANSANGIRLEKGSIAEATNNGETGNWNEPKIQKLSETEESVLREQFESMNSIQRNIVEHEYRPLELQKIRKIKESEKWSDRPYVRITLQNGDTKEGYLIEIGDSYSIQPIDSDVIRINRSSIQEISTLRQ
ncbi:hypothetical protein EHQ12_01305 [Leptospira gomenensis]|uniref:Iron dicitrate transport regulator FecR n=1 Tax=Leptospira gomenensis TaxID=2484974 RepID=A0A5F1YAM1_9LEPT|nr:hypothetical protein [Leptospira gomenensis]TGK34453.1 hypothetical protein EHQ17_08470 [Leptospira gomenensis]TGK41839.1 hypothetical protein EHQ07_15440 [Leptospira gomenensis]TGK44776.1 hypothetical protein EHQ12_01305 [Leptospira gomenensis]TGK65163.1 hypothetical protein EHQ13_05820 [Leptospira gomenensis]